MKEIQHADRKKGSIVYFDNGKEYELIEQLMPNKKGTGDIWLVRWVEDEPYEYCIVDVSSALMVFDNN